MNHDRLPEDLDVLYHACSRGDTRAPIQVLQCCIRALTLFDRSLPAAGRQALLEEMGQLARGVQYILEGDSRGAEEIHRLLSEIEGARTSMEETEQQRVQHMQTLGLMQADIDVLKQEVALLGQLHKYAELRSRIKDSCLEGRAYLEVLGMMAVRSAEQESRLKDLEKECVSLLGTMEQILREELRKEEEAWQIKERRVSESQQGQA